VKLDKRFYGLVVVSIISLIAFGFSNFIAIGAVAIAIILGIVIGNTISLDDKYSSGITYAEKSLLSFAIALMGIKLDFSILVSLGLKSIVLIVFGMVVTILVSIWIGKLMGLDKKFALLLGIGNGVCGSSAIGAVAPIIKADKDSIGVSVAIVNLLGTVGIFLVPAIAIAIGLNEIDSGILVGNTLQAVGQVTAGGFSISETAGLSATTVKMGRVLLLTPLVMILIYIAYKSAKSSEQTDDMKVAKVPVFILFFILFSIISSLSLVSDDIKNMISFISSVSLVLAMSAIGLKIKFSSIKNSGKAGLKLASIVFAIQILFTLGLLWIL
jgi:uncharacterized integral membrane protein (TIGR00698 family)